MQSSLIILKKFLYNDFWYIKYIYIFYKLLVIFLFLDLQLTYLSFFNCLTVDVDRI